MRGLAASGMPGADRSGLGGAQIDILDFCSIVGSILYCLAGILSYPSIYARTQGVICSEGAENPPECGPELRTKFVIAVITLVVVTVTLAVSVFIAWTNVHEKRLSEKAAKIVKRDVMTRTETLGEIRDTANQVSLCEMFDGRLLLPWASTFKRHRSGSIRRAASKLGSSMWKLPSLRSVKERTDSSRSHAQRSESVTTLSRSRLSESLSRSPHSESIARTPSDRSELPESALAYLVRAPSHLRGCGCWSVSRSMPWLLN